MGPDVVEVLDRTTSDAGNAAKLWLPVEGEEIQRMLERLPTEARDRVRIDALDVLSRTLPAGIGKRRRAGLIVGQVQSGKTASFTAVSSLARDNSIPLVVLIAGTKTNLLEQSRSRLSDDLGLGEQDAHFRWAHFKSPMPGSQNVALIATRLRDYLEDQDSEDHVAVLVTAMKNSTHMRRLAEVLREVGGQVDMTAVTTLMIDDEVDQATPNLKWKSGSESATYRNLREIREALPRHTLLEYTATPQAPLLVNLADEISPDFTYVLTPGNGYTGGRTFFQDQRNDFVRTIPAADVAALDPTFPEPPESLLAALAFFFLGVTVGLLTRKQGDPAQRSMLIHPSQATAPQGQFARWVRQTRDHWVDLLELPADADRQDWLDTYFEPAYQDLLRQVSKLPERERILERLPKAMRHTRIEEVNTRASSSSQIEWSQGYSWILIGGAMMDRGFTVEGLSVTYMPRPVGVGNADTVQQRARFFGYKKGYSGFCRAWLSSDVADVFTSYVEHEERMRKELQEQAASGQSLKQWRRRFLLDKTLRPTRRAVISMLYAHKDWSDTWFQQWHVPLPAAEDEDQDIGLANSRLVTGFIDDLKWHPEEVAPKLTEMQRHDVAQVSVARLLNDLLADYAMVEDDINDFASIMLGIEEFTEAGPDDLAVVYNMSQGRERKRSLVEDSTRIRSLFQGRSRDHRYPGDRNIRDDSRLTLQIHWIRPAADDGTDVGGDALRSTVPLLAMYVPGSLGFGVVVAG